MNLPKRRCALMLFVFSTSTVIPAAVSPADACDLPQRAQDLLDEYPGLQVYADPETCGVSAFYGKPMTPGGTPDAAAAQWMADWGNATSNAFGIDDLDLRGVGTNGVGTNGLGSARFTVFRYRQFINTTGVVGASVRLLVLSGDPDRVVYVGGRLDHEPAGGFRNDTVDAETALASVQDLPAYADLTDWSEPEMVVFAGAVAGQVPAVRAWMFSGVNPDLSAYEAYTFFVDASDGTLVHVRNEVYEADVDGQVSAYATPGTLPDVAYNPPEEIPLDGAHVHVDTNGVFATDFCNTNGEYLLTDLGTNALIVEANLAGEWVTVVTEQGDNLHFEQAVTPPESSVDFVFNSNGTSLDTAQVNAFVHVTRAHNWYKARQPAFDALDSSIGCYVNKPFTCNAWFSPDPVPYPAPFLWFGDGGDDCANMARSTIVAHEYGHFTHYQLQLRPGPCAFIEGFADSFAILIYNEPIIGRDGKGPGKHGRDVAAANVQFPCPCAGGGCHSCGQLLAGAWWDVNVAMQNTNGPEQGLADTQQLFTDWSQIASGPDLANNAAHRLTAIEVLAADDDNGDLCSNGLGDYATPNYCAICLGFGAHDIHCPPCLLLDNDCTGNGIPDECEPDCNTNGVADSCDIAAGTSEDCTSNGIPDECEPDCNTNGAADSCDIAAGTSADCNANGVPDECDIDAGTSDDCNTNGVPDECSGDCNTNGTWDECDVYAGTSADCNSNGTPDECEADCNTNGSPDDCDIDAGTSNDCNTNGVPDGCDVAAGTSNDCNTNGAPDGCDIDAGTSEDCTSNGVPDECEPDCNTNGVADSCDIAEGTSSDCNSTGVPDECELLWNDCNTNSVPDECDIAEGTSEDCNTNGTPDECEPDCNMNGVADDCDIDAGTSNDCNTNGIPDECELCWNDCNTNGVPDEYDLAGATSADVNSNNVPDECEDCNTNGVFDADECFPNDYDRDGDADLDDFAYFQLCFNTNGVINSNGITRFDCECAFDWVDTNGLIDLVDFAVFQDAHTNGITGGPHRPCWYDAQPSPCTRVGGGGGGGRSGGGEGGGGERSAGAPPDLWKCEQADLAFEVRLVSGTQREATPLTVLAPNTTYALHYRAGYDRVNFYTLAAAARSADQGLRGVAPPPEGYWSTTGNFEFLDVESEYGELIPATRYPEGYFWTDWTHDRAASWPDPGDYAGPRGHLCNFTTGSAGELNLVLQMNWHNPEERYVVTMEAEAEFRVRAPEPD